MIHKIESLVSIGKFRNFQASGDVAFKKLTLIYADNGSGKTTLSSIFRSLTENNPERILKRKTIGSSVVQSAKILQRPLGAADVTHTFSPAGWRHLYPDIEIFDVHFVDENIYSGCEFNEEHRKQLHQFVIGAQSVAIQQQIDQNKADKATCRTSIGALETQLVNQTGNGLTAQTLQAFISIKPAQANNINQRISDATIALQNANGNAVIQTLQLLTVQTPIELSLNFDALAADLTATTQNIQDQALQALFDQHAENLITHGIEEPESWLKTGFRYIEHKEANGIDAHCPFCTQHLPNTLQIINAYTNLFNEEFNALTERLNGYLEIINNINFDVEIQRITNTNNLNQDKISSWNTYLPANAQFQTNEIIPDETKLKENLVALTRALKLKAQNPALAVDTSTLTTFKAQNEMIERNTQQYNSAINAYNSAIATFRFSIQTVPQAQNNLSELERIKKRFDSAINALCVQLQSEKQKLRTLETSYTALSLQQQQAAQTFFTTYKDRINYYLQNIFKTSFAIDDVAHIAPQGRATQNKIAYRLTMEGHDISFDTTHLNNTKDCLSEGDKSTIALAFFLSKLDISSGKANKILIFDDPLSSFDSNRRMYTVQLIKDLLPQLKQVIVLSHNEYFLHEIYKRIAASERKTLIINRNYLTNSSFIEQFDLEKLVENAYFKHVKLLESFLQSPDINNKDTVLGCLRNVLESHIRFKFYRQLRGIPANDQTFGRIITALSNSGTPFRCSNRLQVIDKLNLINAISCKPHHGEPLPDFEVLGVNPTSMNLPELCSFVQDTIELIDNQL